MGKEDIYDKLQKQRVIFLGTPIDDSVANDLIARFLFLQMDNPSAPIQFCINSPGGSVTAGLAIYDTIKFLKTPVVTYNVGLSHSMACLLLTAGTPGQRYIREDAMVGFSETTGGEKEGQTERAQQYIEKLQKRMEEIYLANTRLSREVLRDLSARSVTLTAQQAVSAGIVDAIARPDNSNSL